MEQIWHGADLGSAIYGLCDLADVLALSGPQLLHEDPCS
jgi:hypothetical protein